MLSKSQFYAPVIFLGVQSQLDVMVVYLNKLRVKKTLSARVNFYQHVVGVDFPGEVVKVHPAESYLLVFDLCSYLVYCLN